MAEPPRKQKCDETEEGPIVTRGMFGDRIILPHTKPQQHNSEYLPAGHLSFEIIGCSGCGKSHLLLDMLPQIANLSQVIVCSLVVNNPVYDVISRWCESTEDPKEFAVFTDPETAASEIQELMETKKNEKPDTNGIVVFDDFSQQKSGRNDAYNQFTNSVCALLRNYGYHSCFITQSSTNVPTLYRNNVNVRVIFQMNDSHAIQSIRRDLVAGKLVKSSEYFDQLYEMVQSEEHAFLMVVGKGADKRLMIWLPKFGTDKPPKEVEFAATGTESLEDDDHLKKLIGKYEATLEHNDAYSRMQRMQAKEVIKKYIHHLAQDSGVDESSLISEMIHIYDIDI